MFASTNLVIELGIVLVILLGWQFIAAECIGGPIMVVLLAAVGGLVADPVEGELDSVRTGRRGSDHV
jgi:hypothetical protein